MDDDDDVEVITARLRRGGASILPGPDASREVHVELSRRRRRTAVLGSSLVAAAVVVAVTATAVIVIDRPDTTGETPAEEPTTVPNTPIENDVARPAALFQDFAGGRARGDSILFRSAPGQRMQARFTWFPDPDVGTGHAVGVALEQFAGPASSACEALRVPGASCSADGSGALASYDTTAASAYVDPLSQVTRLGEPGRAPVRGATWFDPDGWAVSVVVCGCSIDGGLVDAGIPITYDLLETIVTDERWRARPAD